MLMRSEILYNFRFQWCGWIYALYAYISYLQLHIFPPIWGAVYVGQSSSSVSFCLDRLIDCGSHPMLVLCAERKYILNYLYKKNAANSKLINPAIKLRKTIFDSSVSTSRALEEHTSFDVIKNLICGFDGVLTAISKWVLIFGLGRCWCLAHRSYLYRAPFDLSLVHHNMILLLMYVLNDSFHLCLQHQTIHKRVKIQ